MRLFIALTILLALSSCKDKKRYHEAQERVADTPFMQQTLEYRESLNEFFRNPETSPLPDRYRADFRSLDFFPADSTFRIKARIERTPEAVPFMMPTTTDRQTREKVFGVLVFTLKGQEHRLKLYESASRHEDRETLFLPFTDLTNGDATYAGGRYLDLDYPEGDSMIIDFNRAYNPYCVYNKKFSCPLVPRENHLDAEITAGLKMFNP